MTVRMMREVFTRAGKLLFEHHLVLSVFLPAHTRGQLRVVHVVIDAAHDTKQRHSKAVRCMADSRSRRAGDKNNQPL